MGKAAKERKKAKKDMENGNMSNMSDNESEASTSGSSSTSTLGVEEEMRAKIHEQAQQLNEQAVLMNELRRRIDMLISQRDRSSPERKRKNVVAVKAPTEGTVTRRWMWRTRRRPRCPRRRSARTSHGRRK